MIALSKPHHIVQESLISVSGQTCGFGTLLRPAHPGVHVEDLSVDWLRALLRDRQLIVLRGFDNFDHPEGLTRYCAGFGNIMLWPFGAALELLEHEAPNDHIFANSYVPLHWDGMYLDTVPEFQIFQCVRAVDEAHGGRTVFSSTTEALCIAPPETRELWSRAHGEYQRSVELYSNVVRAPIIEQHPYREFPVLRFCEPPPANDRNFINPSMYEFSGIGQHEREALLNSLRQVLYSPRVHYAHRWQTRDMVLADNYVLLHGREAYASGSGRHLRRVHIHGEPVLHNRHTAQRASQ